ncbi:hypothetical protein pb186bvf_005451 [Paramecium bursaria]
MWNNTPTSKICFKRDLERQYQRHRRALSQQRSRLDNRCDVRCLTQSSKYAQQKYIEIDRENRSLLRRLVTIDTNKGRLNQKFLKVNYKLCTPTSYINRQSRAMSIDVENYKLATRLMSASTNYSREHILKTTEISQMYKSNISQNARRYTHFDFSRYTNQSLLTDV